VLEQGLAESPGDQGLLDEIERLAATTGAWTSGAGALRDALEAHRDSIVPDVACTLSLRLAHWLRDHAKDATGAEAALVRGLDFDPDNDEVLRELEELQRGSSRAVDLVATLRRRAKLQPDEVQRADLYRQAKTLAEGLGDGTLAEAILRELLAQDDANGWALAELTKLREAASDYKETYALLVRQAETSVDPESQKSLRRRAAAIARDRLDDAQGAAELYEELFEDDPSDADAATSLRALYAASSRFQELGRLLERLIDVAEAPAKRSDLRLELAKLTEEKFGSADTAIELVRAVLDEEPARAEAVVVLSELYERTKRDEELAELLASQIDAAQSRGDVSSELRFKVRLGEVYETRLGDRAQAIETYRGVLKRTAACSSAMRRTRALSCPWRGSTQAKGSSPNPPKH
jgi:tetratricopeptide (TPR) repeat protein